MKRLQSLLLVIALLASFGAAAQWQWKANDGSRVFSDRPPPADVLEKDILKRPGGARGSAAVAIATAPTASAPRGAAPAPRTAASGPGLKLSGKDGLWNQVGGVKGAGKGVIVGIIDSGMWPENSAFTGKKVKVDYSGNVTGIPGWKGVCQTGERWTTADCTTTTGMRFPNRMPVLF